MMKLVRSLDLPEAGGYAATEKRYSVVLRADVVSTDFAAPVLVRVVNISAGGLMAVVPPEPKLDGRVTITIHDLGCFGGQIVWARDGRIGVQFDAAIDPERLIAERATRAAASARAAARFVERRAGLFDEQDGEETILPFVAMMGSRDARTGSAS